MCDAHDPELCHAAIGKEGWMEGPARQQARAVESEPAPLPTAQNVTVDEVINAYRQACQKLNCRQIPKLLRQLQV